MVGLGDRQLFRDEAASWVEASYPVAELLRHASGEPYPPLYALLLHGWIGAVGDGEAALRWLSVVPGVALVLVGWRWAHEALGRWGGLVALAALAFSPLALENARDARMYAWEAAFAALAWWLVWRLASGRAGVRPRDLVIQATLLGVACAGELWTLALGVVPAVLQGLVVVGSLVRTGRGAGAGRSEGRGRRAGSRMALVGLVGGGVSFIPWLPSALLAATRGEPYWTLTPGWFDWLLSLQVQLVGWRGDTLANLAVAPLLLGALGGLVWLLRSRAPGLGLLGPCLLGGVGFVVAIWAVSQVRSVYDHRYLGAAGAPLAVAIAAGALAAGRLLKYAPQPISAWLPHPSHLAWRLAAVALVVTLSAPFAVEWLTSWRGGRDIAPVRELLTYVEGRVRSGDALLAFDARAYFSLAYEAGRPGRGAFGAAPVLDWDSGHEPSFRGSGLIDERLVIDGAALARHGVQEALRLAPDGRVWLIAEGVEAHGPLPFAPVADGSLRVVERTIMGAERYEAAQAVLLELP